MNHMVLATVEMDQPRLRPITLIYDDGRFFFATTCIDNKVRQLSGNPKIELILRWQEPPNNEYIRVEGSVEKLEDSKIISQLYNGYDFMGKLWTSPADPNLTVYEVKPTAYDYLKLGEWSTLRLRIK